MSFDFGTTAASNPVPVENIEKSFSEDQIIYVSMTQDRLENNKRNLPIVLPHVDRAVIVDGGSKDGTVEYLKSLGPKVEVYHRDWDDSFANQYNEYLKHIGAGWVLLCDDDEVPSEQLLLVLRELIKRSEGGTKFDTVEFRANDVTYVEGDWANRVDNGPCEYYRQIFFKWNPDLRYAVDLHQSLQGLKGPGVRCKEHYYHIKSTKDQFRNACRNYFIAGEWPAGGGQMDGIRTPEWYEMKDILSRNHPEVKLFSHLNGLLVTGNVCPEFIDWVIKYKDHNAGVDGESSGELRCYYRYYFETLFPDKTPKE